MEREPCSIYRFDCANRITFNTGDLHKPAHRITGQAKIMFHPDFGRLCHLLRICAPDRRKTASRHRTGHANFALAAHLRPRYRGALFIKQSNPACREEELSDILREAIFARAIMFNHRRNNARCAISRRGDDLSPARIFFIHRHGVNIEPVKKLLAFIGHRRAM